MVVRLSPPQLSPARISVEQYHQMIRAGVFATEGNVELFEGVLCQKRYEPASPTAIWFNHEGPLLATFTVEQYHSMIRSGALKEDDPIELIEGYLVQKMARNTPHDVSLDLLNELLWKLLPTGLRFRGQSAITLSDSEPEPDGAVVPGPAQRYLRSHPQPGEVYLVIEVADSSLNIDRTHKQRMYARAAIAIYWIVNLVERQVEVYTSPQSQLDEPAYSSRQDYREGDAVPVVIQGVTVGAIPVGDLLPVDSAS